MNKHKLKEKRKLQRERANAKPRGFHVFWERLTDEPIAEGNFNDPTAEIGQRYFYKLTQVDASGNESQPIVPKSSFRDHAGNVFEQNPLVDFAGYNMYRSADRDVPLERWEKRTDAPIPTTEYKDEGVQSGEVYF